MSPSQRCTTTVEVTITVFFPYVIQLVRQVRFGDRESRPKALGVILIQNHDEL